MRLRVAQINLHHCEAASANLLLSLSSRKLDIALIQEPWIGRDGTVKGLGCVGYDTLAVYSCGKVRACIIAKSELNLILSYDFSTGDLVTALLENGNGSTLLLVSVYLPYEERDPPCEAVRRLVQHAADKRFRLLMGCDANAHHSQWGCPDINGRGESVFDFIIQSGLHICNRGDSSTFRTRLRDTIIDLTLTSDESCVRDWLVSDEYSFSDHSTILFTLELTAGSQEPFRNPRRIDWAKFLERLREMEEVNLPPCTSAASVNEKVNFVTDLLYRCFIDSCPLTFPGKRRQPVWWSKDLAKLRKATRKLFNRAKRTKTDEDWMIYKSSFNKFKGDIRKAKRAAWISFCETIHDVNDAARFRRVLSKNPKGLGLIRRSDGSWTSSGAETLELLMETHFPGCGDVPLPGALPGGPLSDLSNLGIIDEIVSESRLLWAIHSFRPYKSPGPDGILPVMLQRSASVIIPHLRDIYRTCLRLSVVPDKWKEVLVIFIPKAGKTSHVSPKDFRPISLSSFLMKVLERLIDVYIREGLGPRRLCGSQHAYMKGRSVETALHDVVGHIERNLGYGDFTLAAFLDIEGAFNNVTSCAIRRSLESSGVSPLLVAWIGTMLSNRFVSSVLGVSSIRKWATRGTPQGGVLSPLLWLLVVNEILTTFELESRRVVAYADDLVIMTAGKSLSTISELMQTALSSLSNWARGCGLGVNPLKTELVLFTRRYKIGEFRRPRLDGIELSLSSEAKYLGVILDQKLNWKRNSEERMKKGLNALYACRNSIGKSWGLSPKVVHWLYVTIVRPIITYGCLVWWPALEKSCQLQLLSKVQRTATLCISGARRSAPRVALDVIFDLTPLDIFVRRCAARSALRLREIGLWANAQVGHATALSGMREIDGVDRLSETSDYIMPTLDFDMEPMVVMMDRSEWEDGVPQSLSGVLIYTDGSKMETGSGAGIFCEELHLSMSIRLHDDCSVFQAEVAAIVKAACVVRDLRMHLSDEYVICSDSKAAINAVRSVSCKSKLVNECRRILKSAGPYGLRLCWVPGHSDIAGNLEADRLAKEGCAGEDLDTFVRPPICHFYGLIERWARLRVDHNWRIRTDCVISRSLWPCLSPDRTRLLLQMRRNDVRLLIGVVTGHCDVRDFTSRWGIVDTDYCRVCGDEEEAESIEHLLCRCPALLTRRRRCLGWYQLDGLMALQRVPLVNLLEFVRGLEWLRG